MRNGEALCCDGIRNSTILRIEQIDNRFWGREVDIDSARIATFGDARIKRRSGHESCKREAYVGVAAGEVAPAQAQS